MRGVIQSTKKIGESAKPCSTPTSASQALERKEFQEYWVDLPTRQSEKKSTMQSGKPKYLRIKVSILWFKEGKNCVISNATTLVLSPLAQLAHTKCIRNIPAFSVDYWATPSSQLEWRMLYLTASNWSHLTIIFSMSLSSMLSRIIGLNFFLIINLLYSARLQFITDYLLQAAYNFCLRRLKPPLQAERHNQSQQRSKRSLSKSCLQPTHKLYIQVKRDLSY